MRHALVRLAGLLIVVTLVLSGCNLIGVDPMMQLDEDFAAAKKNFSNVVATYDGGELTQEDVMYSFTSQYTTYSSLYSQFGMTLSASDVTSMRDNAVNNGVQMVAINQQFEARGLSVSDEAAEEAQANADANYQSVYDSFYASASGETEEVRVRQTEYDMYVNGYTREAIDYMETSRARYDALMEDVQSEITEVTDEELQAAYDEKVAADEALYADAPGSFESAMMSDTTDVYWMPEGYRTVKHILVIPDAELLTAVTDARSAYASAESALETLREELDALNDDDAEAEEEEEAEEADEEPEEAEGNEAEEAPRTAEDIQAEIDQAESDLAALKADVEAAEAACLEATQDKLDEIYEKLDAGEDFDALIEEYGEDPGMKNEPTSTRGYYVSANSTTWDQRFTDAAMTLEAVGDYSETPVLGDSGYHIIRYASDVTPGAVALEDVREALYDETLETMKNEHFESELTSWVDALHPQYNYAAFNIGL